MIEELGNRNDGVFDKELDDDHQWLKLFNDEGDYAYVAIQIIGHEALIHLNIVRWNKGTLKDGLADWQNILYACKNAGVSSLIAANKNYEDKRWAKLIKYFGFEQPLILAVSKQKI